MSKWFIILNFNLKLFLIYFLNGTTLSILFYRYLKKSLSFWIVYISSVGLSMYIITIILNYLLMVFHSFSDIFYLGIILLYFILLLLFAIRYYTDFKQKLFSYFENKKIKIHYLLPVVLMFILFSIGWNYYISLKKITEHDTLEYATQGKVFYKDKYIKYSKHRYDDESGFYYVGLHGFSFPLILTIEKMTNNFLNSEDLLFRSVNSFYGILILCLTLIIISEYASWKYAIIVLIAVLLNYGFFETIMKYHIDNYRVFFVILSFYLLLKLQNDNTYFLWLFYSLILGAMANIHSLGFMISIIELSSLLIFLQEKWIDKIKKALFGFTLMMIFGGVHYLIDVFWGTGWIFKDIKFY